MLLFFFNDIYSIKSGERNCGVAHRADCGNQQRVLSELSSAAAAEAEAAAGGAHRMKCVTTIQFPHLPASASCVRIVPHVDRFTR